jgi:hypothetical protein
MEAFVDLSKLSIEEITGTLKSSDDAEEETTPPPNSSPGKLLLTHEEWVERYKSQDGGRGGSGSGGAAKLAGAASRAGAAAVVAAPTAQAADPAILTPGRALAGPDLATSASTVAKEATGLNIVVANLKLKIRPMWPRRKRSTHFSLP